MSGVLMQAIDDGTGDFYTWFASEPDFAGTGYPGPNDPLEIAANMPHAPEADAPPASKVRQVVGSHMTGDWTVANVAYSNVLKETAGAALNATLPQARLGDSSLLIMVTGNFSGDSPPDQVRLRVLVDGAELTDASGAKLLARDVTAAAAGGASFAVAALIPAARLPAAAAHVVQPQIYTLESTVLFAPDSGQGGFELVVQEILAGIPEPGSALLYFDIIADDGVVGANSVTSQLKTATGILATDKVIGVSVPTAAAASGLVVTASVNANDQVNLVWNNGTGTGSTNGSITYRIHVVR